LGKDSQNTNAQKQDEETTAMEVDQGSEVIAAPSDLEDFETGQYELVGIISHQGRSADGGHYVGWVRHKKADGKDTKDDVWYLFDDDNVYRYEWKQMTGLNLDLQGGRADTQIAYVCLYKKVSLRMSESLVNSEAARLDAELSKPSDTKK